MKPSPQSDAMLQKNHQALMMVSLVVGLGFSTLIISGKLVIPNYWLATAVSFVSIMVLPGWLSLTLLRARLSFSISTKVPLAFGVTLGLLSPGAVILLALQSPLFYFKWLVICINWGLGLLVLWRYGRQLPTARPATAVRPSLPFLIITILLVTAVFLIYWQTTSIRDAGDHWFYLHFIRHYQEHGLTSQLNPLVDQTATNSTAARAALNGWWVILALFTQAVGHSLMTVYWLALPPLLMLLSILAFYSLARELFQNSDLACVATCIQIIFILTSVHSHDWLGHGFFLRQSEDKFLVWFILLPVSFTLLLRWLRERQHLLWVLQGIVLLALILTHPLGGALWLFLFAAFLGLHILSNGRKRPFLWLLLITGGIFLLLLSQQTLFNGRTGAAPIYGAAAQAIPSRSEIYLLSAIANRYITHPHLIAHPLTLTAIFLTPLLLWQIHKEVARQFLFVGMAAPLFFLFNPITAPMLGRFTSPLLVWRIIWLLPVALTLTYFVDWGWRWWHAKEEQNSHSATAVTWPSFVFLLLLSLGLLNHYLNESWSVLNDYQARSLKAAEIEILDQLNAHLPANTTLLAEPLQNTHIPGFMSTAQLLTFRIFQANATAGEEIHRFFSATTIDSSLLDWLSRRQITAVLLPTTHPLTFAADNLPHHFSKRSANDDYILYTFTPTAADDLLISANSALASGEWETAVTLFQLALKTDPTNDLALVGLGQAYLALGEAEAAQATFTQSDTLPAQLGHLQLEISSGENQAATMRCDTLTQQFPAFTAVWEQCGDLFLAQGQTDKAVSYYQQAIPPQQTESDTVLRFAQLLRRKGVIEPALQAYTDVLRLEPAWFQAARQPSLTQVWGRSHAFDRRIERAMTALLEMGSLYEAANNLTAAETAYQQALRLQPTQPEGYDALGQLYLLQGRPEKIVPLYETAVAYNQNLTWPHQRLGRAYLDHLPENEERNRQIEKAITVLQTAVALDWADEPSYAQLSRAYQLMGEPEKSIDLYRSVQNRSTPAIWPETALAQMAVAQDDWETAVSHLQTAITKDPTAVLPHNLLADGYLAREQLAEAEAVYTQAARANPTHAWPHAGLATIYTAQHKPIEAEREVQLALSLEPHNPNLFLTLGNYYRWQKGQPETAVHYYRQAVRLAPEQSHFLSALGSTLVATNQIEEGLMVLQQAAALEPNNAGIQQLLGEALFTVSGAAAARPYYERALNLNPNDVFTLTGLMRIARQEGELAEGQQYGQQAILLAQEPHEIAQAHFELGSVLLAQQHPDALPHLQTAVATLPDNPWFYAALGDYHLLVDKNLPEAIAAFEQAVQLAPNQSILQAALGAALYAADDKAKAQTMFAEAVQQANGRADVYLRIGAAYQQAQAWPEMITLYETAVTHGIQNIDLFIQLGGAYRAVGDQGAALAQYEKAAMINPDHPAIQKYFSETP